MIAAAALAAVAAVLVVATLPGTLELLLVTVGAILPRGHRVTPAGEVLRLAAVVPAHDEEQTIARTVQSLFAAEPAGPAFDVLVVADNCGDATGARAAAAGARVLTRDDPTRRGKGHALMIAFDTLLAEGVDAIVVVDADTEVAPTFVREIRRQLAAGADAVQARYLVRNARASLRTRLLHVALLAFNVLRPRGRDRLGLSAGLYGNGFALTRATIEAVPFEACSLVEDLEYHLRLVRAGRRVRFADATEVRADMPAGGRGVTTQRGRWEGGRARLLVDAAPGLVREVARGRWRLLEPLLDLACAPLAFHVVLLGVLLALPLGATRLYAAGALGLVAAHVGVALAIGGASLADVAVLAAAPAYVVWKLAIVPVIARASRRRAAWIRTERSAEPRP